MNRKNKVRILAVASGGGHWVQLMRIVPAFCGGETEYVTTNAGYQNDVDGRFHIVTDASMWEKAKLVWMFMQVAAIVFRRRPDVVVTTGAAPGFAAIVVGKLLGSRTIWIDSIANSEELSKSGQQARRWADVWLTQWMHLEEEGGPKFLGSVI